MNFSNDGLTLWYGTPDAPAPGDAGPVPRRGVSLTVGVHPANPSNTVLVTYRVDGGLARTVPGSLLRTDYERKNQYFIVRFPDLPSGTQVAYSVVAGCAGRQVPAHAVASQFPSSFTLAPAAPAPPAPPAAQPPAERRFKLDMRFVATVSVRFDDPQFVTDTADGMRVNFFVKEGSVRGDDVSGQVVPASSDHLLIRPDGIGVIRIDAAFVMEGGGVLDIQSGGYVDFGRSAYEAARRHKLPDRNPLVVTPLIATRHPRYRWLSRVQCIGVGETHLDDGKASYHVYAVVPPAA